MKSLIFSLFATLLFVSGTHAQKGTTVETASIKITKNKTVTNFKYSSIGDFEKNSNAVIDEAGRTNTSGSEECSVTIEMTVSVTVNAGLGVVGGEVTTTVSASITASCAGAVAAAKKLRAQLIAMASAH